MSHAGRCNMIDPDESRFRGLSIARQCRLVNISRSSFYFQAQGESLLNLELMRLIDEQFLRTPFFGSRQMMRWLRRQGHLVDRKRVRRLMRKMGLTPIYQAPRTSWANPDHKVYPYLLRDMTIDRPNRVWCADITYIPMRRGFLYLVAIMDWHSRKVLSWRLSNTLTADCCVEALDEALRRFGTPEIFNTDQGSQFTGTDFIHRLTDAGVRISMDGKGRWIDNVFIERLWRSVKYEEVYLKAYESATDARTGLRNYFGFYNTRRTHQSLGSRTPDEVYFQTSGLREAA